MEDEMVLEQEVPSETAVPEATPEEKIAEMSAKIVELDAQKHLPTASKLDKSKLRKQIRTLRAKILELGGTPPSLERMTTGVPKAAVAEGEETAPAKGKGKPKTKQIAVKVQNTAQAGALDRNPQYVVVGKLGDGSLTVVDKGADPATRGFAVVDPTGTIHEDASAYLTLNHPYLFNGPAEGQLELPLEENAPEEENHQPEAVQDSGW